MVAYLDQAGVQHLIAKIRNTFWPVGTILATSTNTSPASYLGGSWEAYAPGRTLVGVDKKHPLNSTGGSETHSHKYGITVGSFYGHSLIAPNDSHLAVWSGLVSYDKDSGEALDLFHEWTKLDDRPVIASGTMINQTGEPYNARRYRYESDTKTGSSLSPYVAVRYWRRIA